MNTLQRAFHEGTQFARKDFSKDPLAAGEYERCIFNDCTFARGDCSHINFLECGFNRCDLSLVILKNTGLRETIFTECKLSGVRFDQCGKLISSLQFKKCILDLASFNKLRIKKTIFEDCSLHETDFSDANLSESVFDHCDLERSSFSHTILEKADLRTSYNYTIDPELNKIKKARFSIHGAAGLLQKYDIMIE